MIYIEILRAVLLDSKIIADNIKNLFSKPRILKVIKKSRIRNHFLRIVDFSDTKILNYLENMNKEFLLKNLYVKNLSKELFSQDIDHIVFKGAYMSDYYQNYSDRPFSDADILINIKCYKKFYSFLDNNSYPHRFNYQYLDRIGYRRTAIEVINSEILPLDFHFKIDSSIFKKRCKFTSNIFSKETNNIKQRNVRPELMVALILYHSIIQNKHRTGPYYLADIKKLLNSDLNQEYLFEILKEFNLVNEFRYTNNLIERICSNTENKYDVKFIKKLFLLEKSSRFFPSIGTLIKQFFQIIDPLPYVNYSGGDINKNRYIEFAKQKLRRSKKRF